MVGTVTRARCANCGAVLTPGFDANGTCPKCQFELHCCKQCRFFDSGAQFECTQPIQERISPKDAKNSCTFYEFRMTIEKDTAPTSYTQPAAPVPCPRPHPGATRTPARPSKTSSRSSHFMKRSRRSFLEAGLAFPVLLAASPSVAAAAQTTEAADSKDSSFDPWVEIHRENLRHNVQEISRRVASRPILAVIKNNGYGMGV